MPPRELVILDVKPGVEMESQSGLQQLWPRIYGALARARDKRVAALIVHPTSNFMGHYLMDPLPEVGVTLLALNTRYVANDSNLIMERVIQDVGAGVRFLRAQGYAKVVLLGNSGGASTVSLYQAEAEDPRITDTPAGDPIEIAPGDLPPADGIALFAAHPGRATIISHWLDASVIDEHDPLSADPALDVFDSRNGPPFSPPFVTAVRAAQNVRWRHITARARARLNHLRARRDGPRDEPFLVFRTCADPRFLDLSLDANDRPPGCIWGDAHAINTGANNIGRFTTLTSWLSQWSHETRADGPACIARTSVPVLHLRFTADASVFPSDLAAWSKGIGTREQAYEVKGATHYLVDRPQLVPEVAGRIAEWARAL